MTTAMLTHIYILIIEVVCYCEKIGKNRTGYNIYNNGVHFHSFGIGIRSGSISKAAYTHDQSWSATAKNTFIHRNGLMWLKNGEFRVTGKVLKCLVKRMSRNH